MAPKGKTPAQIQAEADEARRVSDAAAAEALRKKEADDQLKAIQGSLTNLTTQLAEMGGRVNILATERNASPPAPTPQGFQRTVTPEHIRAARDEGDNNKADMLLMTYNAETIKESMQGVSTQIQTLQHQGVSMIADVVKSQSAGKLPYYERYKKEIDEFLEKAPAESRTHPDMYKWAHDAVVGRHIAEISAEAAETAVRKHMDGGGGYKPGDGGTGGGERKEGDLTIDTVYGDDAKDIKKLLNATGQSLEQYAKRRGYADVQFYLKHVKQFRDQERLEAM